METTIFAVIVGVAGLVLMGVLAAVQWIAVARPQTEWTIKNIYGGGPDITDPAAYFATNQGWAWADAALWAPIQLIGSVGILLGERWGYLLALAASIPYLYTAIQIYIWDRDLSFRKPGATYWIIWAIFPLFGAIQGVYTFARLLD